MNAYADLKLFLICMNEWFPEFGLEIMRDKRFGVEFGSALKASLHRLLFTVVYDGTNVRMESIPGRLVFWHRFWVSDMVSYLPTSPIVDCI